MIKPAVQRLLASGLGAPLAFQEPRNNPGSLRIGVDDLYAWLARDDVVLGLE